MTKNILIYLFGAWTACSIWGHSTGITKYLPPGLDGPFALLSVVSWLGTLIGLVIETLKTLDKTKS